jgi:hypothetical protein
MLLPRPKGRVERLGVTYDCWPAVEYANVVTEIVKHRQIVLDYNDVVGAGNQTVLI